MGRSQVLDWALLDLELGLRLAPSQLGCENPEVRISLTEEV